MIKVEEGKFYKTRGGEVVGPAKPTLYSYGDYSWTVPHNYGFHGYTEGGESCLDHKDDLVEEYDPKSQEPAHTVQEPSGHSIDMLKAIKDSTESYGYAIKGYSDDGEGLVTIDLVKE